MAKIIIDSGPLYALIDFREEFHRWSAETSQTLSPPLITCEAVLTETCFLISEFPPAIERLRAMLATGTLVIDYDVRLHLDHIFQLMKIYRNLPMSFADACLVSMVEQNSDAAIFTLDRHFTLYRQNRRKLIPLIAPF